MHFSASCARSAARARSGELLRKTRSMAGAFTRHAAVPRRGEPAPSACVAQQPEPWPRTRAGLHLAARAAGRRQARPSESARTRGKGRKRGREPSASVVLHQLRLGARARHRLGARDARRASDRASPQAKRRTRARSSGRGRAAAALALTSSTVADARSRPRRASPRAATASNARDDSFARNASAARSSRWPSAWSARRASRPPSTACRLDMCAFSRGRAGAPIAPRRASGTRAQPSRGQRGLRARRSLDVLNRARVEVARATTSISRS